MYNCRKVTERNKSELSFLLLFRMYIWEPSIRASEYNLVEVLGKLYES